MIEVRSVVEADLPRIISADGGPWWRREEPQWRGYLAEQARGERISLFAELDGAVAGYGHLVWRAQYPPFVDDGVPEISDLRTGQRYRGRGVASAIIARCEAAARDAGHAVIGLGVGLYADYGPAQRLYARLGYRPDGRGLTYENAAAIPGERYRVDDALLLWLVKPLSDA
jgi:GNAT superfamily N-acetyltransferase